jgi:16S rRNA (guanine966-N2)-methyltransferase
VRIIAGRLKGQIFDTPNGHTTHPMSEKVRGALFNILGDVEDLTILDVFGGSGGLSLEAISRGASYATIIESDRNAQMTIRDNISRFGLTEQIKPIYANASSWMKHNREKKFDIVIADPPYNKLQHDLIESLGPFVEKDGLLVLSWPKNERMPKFPDLKLLERKDYGDAQLIFYSLI